VAISCSATVVASARHDDLEAGRRIRRYTITDDGRAALAEARRALRELADELL
jgi:DNA-binding PadR family transcriptional regulator